MYVDWYGDVGLPSSTKCAGLCAACLEFDALFCELAFVLHELVIVLTAGTFLLIFLAFMVDCCLVYPGVAELVEQRSQMCRSFACFDFEFGPASCRTF